MAIVCRGMAWLKMDGRVPRDSEGKLVKEQKCQGPFPEDGSRQAAIFWGKGSVPLCVPAPRLQLQP